MYFKRFNAKSEIHFASVNLLKLVIRLIERLHLNNIWSSITNVSTYIKPNGHQLADISNVGKLSHSYTVTELNSYEWDSKLAVYVNADTLYTLAHIQTKSKLESFDECQPRIN